MKWIAVLALAAPLAAQTITPRERSAAMERLRSSRKAFFDSIRDVSAAQWNFKPAPDRWSVGECAEHIVLTEDVYFRSISKLLSGEPSKDRKAELSDQDLLKLYTDRSQKRQAPEPIQPTRGWSRAEIVQRFNQARDRVINLAATTQLPLRSYVSPAAAGGRWMDGYQWFLRVAGHAERHTAQIDEVKAHPGYPR
jgi:uncharacterized damage-inducible protein DinB